jgi:hypothetical protein
LIGGLVIEGQRAKVELLTLAIGARIDEAHRNGEHGERL